MKWLKATAERVFYVRVEKEEEGKSTRYPDMGYRFNNGRSAAVCLIVILILFPVFVFAQLGTVQWQKRYGLASDQEVANAVAKIDANLYVLGGEAYRPVPVTGYRYPFVVFTNAQGDSIGSYLYSNINGNIRQLITEGDNTFTALGFQTVIQPRTDSIFLFKANSDGTIIWKRSIDATDRMMGPYRMVHLPDGYLVAWTRSPLPNSLARKLAITRLDSEGRYMWERYYSISNYDDKVVDFIPTSDGSYTLMGTTWGRGVLTGSTYDGNYLFLKLRPNGDSIRSGWTGMYNIKEEAMAIRETKDGGFLCLGTYLLPGQTERVQGHVLKVDSLWSKQWDVKIMPGGGSNSAGCELTGVQELVNGDFIISGTNRPQPGVTDGYVAKVRPNLGFTLAATYLHQNNRAALPSTMLYEADGSAIMAGFGGVVMSGNSQMFAARLTNLGQPYQLNYCATPPTAHFSYRFSNDTLYLSDSSRTHLPYDVLSRWDWDFGGWTSHKEGQQVQPFYFPPSQQVRGNYLRLTVTNNLFCTDTLTFYPWGLPPVAAPEQQPLQVQVYPNPAKAQVQFVLPLAGEGAQLQLYSGSGQLVRQQTLQPGQNRLSLQGLPQGLYLYHLQHGARQQRGKLVKG